jgi:hypothetical protein
MSTSAALVRLQNSTLISLPRDRRDLTGARPGPPGSEPWLCLAGIFHLRLFGHRLWQAVLDRPVTALHAAAEEPTPAHAPPVNRGILPAREPDSIHLNPGLFGPYACVRSGDLRPLKEVNLLRDG